MVTLTMTAAQDGTSLSKKRGSASLNSELHSSRVTRSRWCGRIVTSGKSFAAQRFSFAVPVRSFMRKSMASSETTDMVKPAARAAPTMHPAAMPRFT